MAEIIPKPALLNSSSAGELASGGGWLFGLLRVLFFIFVMFYGVVDDEKNDKPDEEGAEKTFNH